MNAAARFGAVVTLAAVMLAQAGHAQQSVKVTPRLEAIAETKLLMNGLAHANFKGLERLLTRPPGDDQAWTFARGQALLLAETGNLLMLRPPRNSSENLWFERAMAFRAQAVQLAQIVARKDHDGARGELSRLAESCNRCHTSFRVPVQIEAFAVPAPPEPK